MHARYYNVLNLTPSASVWEIHTAYRKKVKAAHPDKKSGSDEQMKLINEAYSELLLLNSERKYSSKQKSTSLTVQCSISELFSGTIKKVDYSRKRIIDGVLLDQTVVFEVTVPAGSTDGNQIIFYNQGNQYTDLSTEHVIFIVKEVDNSDFSRSGDDVCTSATISLIDALTGETNVRVKGIDGDHHMLPLLKPTQPGSRCIIKGQGAFIGHTRHRGNLIVTVNIQLPTISSHNLQQLKSILQ